MPFEPKSARWLANWRYRKSAKGQAAQFRAEKTRKHKKQRVAMYLVARDQFYDTGVGQMPPVPQSVITRPPTDLSMLMTHADRCKARRREYQQSVKGKAAQARADAKYRAKKLVDRIPEIPPYGSEL